VDAAAVRRLGTDLLSRGELTLAAVGPVSELPPVNLRA
jgi:hypothetical protein